MSQGQESIRQQPLQGIASGVLLMAFFGTLWASIGLTALQGLGAPWLLLIIAIIGLGLLAGGLILWRRAGSLPKEIGPESAAAAQHIGMWYVIIFAAEGIAIGIASYICTRIDRFDLFFPITAIIVGIHFLPLARLFQVNFYYLIGILLCVVGLIALFLTPQTALVADRELVLRSIVAGFGCAIILWGTGLTLWNQGRAALQHAQGAENGAALHGM